MWHPWSTLKWHPWSTLIPIACHPWSTNPLRNRLTKPGYGKEGPDFDALAGSAPAFEPSAAAGAEEDAFKSLWRAYNLRKDKKAARDAYNRLKPDAAQQASLIESATAWRQAWEAKPDSRRKYLATWLSDESWDCEAPGKRSAKFEKKPGKPAVKPKPKPPAPANDNSPETYPWREVMTIHAAEFLRNGGTDDLFLRLELLSEDGRHYEEVSFCMDSPNEDYVAEDSQRLEEFKRAAEIAVVGEDSRWLLERKVGVVMRTSESQLTFEPLSKLAGKAA